MRYKFLPDGSCVYMAKKNGRLVLGTAKNFDEAWDKCAKLYR